MGLTHVSLEDSGRLFILFVSGCAFGFVCFLFVFLGGGLLSFICGHNLEASGQYPGNRKCVRDTTCVHNKQSHNNNNGNL